MADELMPVLPWTKNLLDRLTATRAGYLDNLQHYTSTVAGRIDATISSRAAAATALANSTWTDARAAFLDAAISSRAAAATALSTATWTSARAARLDNLDAPVSGVSPVASIQGGGVSTIANLQTGASLEYETRYIDVTIAAVNVAKCVVLVTGYGDVGGVLYPLAGRLTSSTNLRIGVGVASSAPSNFRGRWQVVEYK